jgi:hypothetical protein
MEEEGWVINETDDCAAILPLLLLASQCYSHVGGPVKMLLFQYLKFKFACCRY